MVQTDKKHEKRSQFKTQQIHRKTLQYKDLQRYMDKKPKRNEAKQSQFFISSISPKAPRCGHVYKTLTFPESSCVFKNNTIQHQKRKHHGNKFKFPNY